MVVAQDAELAEAIAFVYEGADRVIHETDATVRVETAAGSLVEVVSGDSRRTEIAWDRFEIVDGVGLSKTSDPSGLLWSTFLGGEDGREEDGSVVLDASGNLVVTGYTVSVDFPTTPGAYDESYNRVEECFVAKLSADGSALLWSTFLGGFSIEGGKSVVLDSSGNPVVSGYTGSVDFPTTTGAYDESNNGGYDVFLAKLSSDGSALLWCTLLGGGDGDGGGGVVLDSSDNPVVEGWTYSADFPTTRGVFDESYNGENDVFLAKFSSDGSALLWCTLLGGSDYEFTLGGVNIVLDASGNPVLTGETGSSDFPTTPGAYDESIGGIDAFLTKVSSDGTTLLWSTFLGGTHGDRGRSLALDSEGNPVVTGRTAATDFPTTPGVYDDSFNGFNDVFLAKLASDGSALLWSTFLGGSSRESGWDVILDPAGNPVVTGYTESAGFPTTSWTYDESYNGREDAFVAKFSSDGSALLWSTFLGGGEDDSGTGVIVDTSGQPIVVGWTGSSEFPTTPGAYDESYNGGNTDTFVAHLAFLDEPTPVLLEQFLAEAVAGGAVLTWRVNSDFALDRFFLDRRFGSTWERAAEVLFSVGHQTYEVHDTVEPGTYLYRLTGRMVSGREHLFGEVEATIPQWNSLKASLEILNNPSSGGHVVALHLAAETRVEVGVYDVRGRRVRVLMSGRREASSYRLPWDGRDDSGRAVPSGIYWVTLAMNGQEQGLPVALIR
jgi:hypothetical protein